MACETMAAPIERICEGLDAQVTLSAPLAKHTWFGVGGGCDALVQPRSEAALSTLLRRCAEADIPVRVLGQGANLLVSDEGVDGVVLKLDQPCFSGWQIRAHGDAELVQAGGGSDMARVMHESVREGLGGLEPMAGIPASVGGAVRMNAGGRYGAIGDVVERVTMMDAHGRVTTHERTAIHFDYRHNDLPQGLVLSALFRLQSGDKAALRDRVVEIMKYKKSTQPMAENSAGCMFRNPTLPSGERVSAGMLIDRSGLKGLAVGSASVSPAHANFICVDKAGGHANDVMRLVERVVAQVQQSQQVSLQTEVVFWRRGDRAGAMQ